MSASTIAAIVSCDLIPPSNFTACALPSCISRAALRNASLRLVWYVMNGMSAMTNGRLLPRTTAAVARTMSSRVTGIVESYPSDTLP